MNITLSKTSHGIPSAPLVPQNPLHLATEERTILFHDYERLVRGQSRRTKSEILDDLEGKIVPDSFAALKKETERQGFVKKNDLAQVQAYLEFLAQRQIETASVSLSVLRGAGNGTELGYVLVDSALSLHGAAGDAAGLTWTHGADWAEQRFFQNRSGRYILGGMPEAYKFATLARLQEGMSVPEIQKMLGLTEDYIPNIIVELTPSARKDLLQDSPVGVPVIYKVKEQNQAWKKYEWFGVKTVPGYTSAGAAEIVFRTVTAEAPDLETLTRRGANIWRIRDGAVVLSGF